MTAAILGVDCPVFLANATLIPAMDSTLIPALNSSQVTVVEPMLSNSSSWACDPYVGQLIYVNCYGVTSAAYVLLTTLVLADLLGADRFTNSFGLLLLFQGVATFVGPPVVGFLFDAYCSYNSGFLLMGAMIALSGAMLYPIPCIRNALSEDLELHRGAEPLIQDVAEPEV